MSTNLPQLLARLLALATAIPLHEASHAWVSEKLGDPTGRSLGRITLNPLKHFDPWGFVAMLVIGFGWAKPVPINPRYYKNPKRGMAISAAAGPVSNFLLAYISMLLYKVVLYISAAAFSTSTPWFISILFSVLETFVYLNVVLGVFNMLPVPPFDGSRILSVFLPDRIYFGIQKHEHIVLVVVAVLMLTGTLSGFLGGLYIAVFRFMDWATGYVDMLFLAILF